MPRWISTKAANYVESWDRFVAEVADSSFLQATHRLSSYEQYGADWELMVLLDDEGNIVAGSANVIVKLFFFKVYFCAYGPLVRNLSVFAPYRESYVKHLVSRSRELKCFALQVTLSANECPVWPTSGFLEGSVIQQLASHRFANIIELRDAQGVLRSREDLIKTFSGNGRRDCRASYRKGLVARRATTVDDLREAYACIESNGKNKGYPVRSWDDFGPYLLGAVKSGMAFVLTAWHGDELQGAVVLERAGPTLTYTMGGVRRHVPDLLSGYFLQVEAMQLAGSVGMDFYDISHGGPEPVRRFKSMFSPVLAERGKSLYKVNNKLMFFLFQRAASPRLKGFVSKILKGSKGVRK